MLALDFKKRPTRPKSLGIKACVRHVLIGAVASSLVVRYSVPTSKAG